MTTRSVPRRAGSARRLLSTSRTDGCRRVTPSAARPRTATRTESSGSTRSSAGTSSAVTARIASPCTAATNGRDSRRARQCSVASTAVGASWVTMPTTRSCPEAATRPEARAVRTAGGRSSTSALISRACWRASAAPRRSAERA